MSSRQLRVGLLSFGAWRFEVFDQAAGGWKIILHPAPGSSVSPQTLITDHANGLAELGALNRILELPEIIYQAAFAPDMSGEGPY